MRTSSPCTKTRVTEVTATTIEALWGKSCLARLQTLASCVYPESKYGFCAGRSIVDMVFFLRQLQKMCQEQQMPLYLAFIDVTKAFDMVSRSGLFQIGCPPHLLAVITSFHDNIRSTVCVNCATFRACTVSSSVKQGCVIVPTLFGIFSMFLQYTFKDCSKWVYIQTRADGKLQHCPSPCQDQSERGALRG
ncbi:uncharacterized protein LOC134764233 [Penaeus indicus]|uniref:uncharacterized protein LOC134764233 n=1 Tax=Penaeus indicus TaxID=29960 RepID=UPI00300D31E4